MLSNCETPMTRVMKRDHRRRNTCGWAYESKSVAFRFSLYRWPSDATSFPAAVTDYVTPAAYCLAAAVAIGLYSIAQNIGASLRARGRLSFEKPVAVGKLGIIS
jgi:hypothetical protein